MQWIGTLLFSAAIGVEMYAVPDSWPMAHDAAWTAIVIGTYVLGGVLVGRWWALALVLLPILLAVPAGSDGDVDGAPLWHWIVVDTVAIGIWAMLVGILLAKAISWLARERAARQRSVSEEGA